MRRLGIRRQFTPVVVAALCGLSPVFAAAATRYDPRLRFSTISTARFDIHFHQGEEKIARRLAGLVEPLAAEVDRAVGAAVGRVQIILVDQHDLSNGWATPLPYNTIEISTATPSAESSIGNTHDWLPLVFVHEYTHIAHLSRAAGWVGGLRRGFGRLPVLFPNLYQPVWGIEGIATWRETASTGQGRVQAGDFRLMLRQAAIEGRFDPIDRANGGNIAWPGAATPYLYGAYFHQYLSDRFGHDSLRLLTEETSRRLPYLGSRAYRKVFGQSLGQLWKDFTAVTIKAANEARPAAATAVRLTRHGFNVSSPRYAADGRVFYSASSPHHFPALLELAVTGRSRHVVRRYLGNTIAFAGDRLVIDEIDLIRNVGLKSDLYLVDPRNGSRRRLTYDARAGDPDVASSGTVVCTLQMTDRRALGTFTISPETDRTETPELLISEESTNFSGPRWSPDSRLIAAERRRVGSHSQIVLVDPSDRTVRVLADLPGGRSAAPTWTPDGRRVLFSSAVDGEPFRIYSVDVTTGAIFRLEGTGASAQSPDVSRDGESLVFVGYTADGYDLFSVSLAAAQWTPWSPKSDDRTNGPLPPGEPAWEPRAYSPWRTLLPQFWTPTVESDAGEVVVGAATGSADALGRHAYGFAAGWSARARPDWQVGYAYDRWWPTLFFSVADDTDSWRLGEVRTVETDIGTLMHVSRIRFSHTALATFHVGVDAFDCQTCEPAVDADRTRASVRMGWQFGDARSFGYSISAEEGQRISITAETTRRGLGADGNGFALTADARAYRRVGASHAVAAVRGALARSWGDRDAERQFSASGPGPQLPGFRFETDAIALLRGFDEGDVVGTRAVVVNADFRLPLARIDRGFGTFPLFVRNIHGALFIDAGHAWVDRVRWTDARVSVGAELSVDTVVGFALPLTFTVGGAWLRDVQEKGRVAAFGRIGRAF